MFHGSEGDTGIAELTGDFALFASRRFVAGAISDGSTSLTTSF